MCLEVRCRQATREFPGGPSTNGVSPGDPHHAMFVTVTLSMRLATLKCTTIWRLWATIVACRNVSLPMRLSWG